VADTGLGSETMEFDHVFIVILFLLFRGSASAFAFQLRGSQIKPEKLKWPL
jgi:hypothetical protein